MNKISNKLFCLVTMVICAMATETLIERGPFPLSSEICKVEPKINVTINLTADNYYNLFIGNKDRITSFVGGDFVWQN